MTERVKKIAASYEEQIVLAFYIAGVAVINILMKMDFGDDTTMKEMTAGFSVIEWLVYRYNNWSARFLQDGLGFFMIWHPYLWKLLNAAVHATIPLLFSYITGNDKKGRIICISAVLLYPIADMASAGWICTTITYLWPVWFELAECCIVRKYVTGGRIKWYDYLIFYVSLAAACNHELLAAFNLCILVGITVYQVYHKKTRYKLLTAGALINAADLLFIVTAPGNELRKVTETGRWFPAHAGYNFAEKIYLGIARVFDLMLCNPNPIFFVFSIVIILASVKVAGSGVKRIISCVPLALVFMLNYVCPSFAVDNAENVELLSFSCLLVLAVSFTVLACITISLYEIFTRISQPHNAMLSLVILYAGLATTVVMGLSPTIYASQARTSAFTYFSFIYLIIMLIKICMDERAENNIFYKMFLYMMSLAMLAGNALIASYIGK